MKKILYIYGYGGSAQGSTCTMLRRLVPENYMVESFTYTQADFSKARQEILDYIREHGIDLVVGSSLGGFIALTLSGIPRIVVNPCWYPGEELPLIDVPHEIVRTYAPHDHWVQEHITEEDRPMVHAFFGDRDELFWRPLHRPFPASLSPGAVPPHHLQPSPLGGGGKGDCRLDRQEPSVH